MIGKVVGHALIGGVPIAGGPYEGYQAAKHGGAGKAGRTGAAVAGIIPGVGVIAGGIHGYEKGQHFAAGHAHTQGPVMHPKAAVHAQRSPIGTP